MRQNETFYSSSDIIQNEELVNIQQMFINSHSFLGIKNCETFNASYY